MDRLGSNHFDHSFHRLFCTLNAIYLPSQRHVCQFSGDLITTRHLAECWTSLTLLPHRDALLKLMCCFLFYAALQPGAKYFPVSEAFAIRTRAYIPWVPDWVQPSTQRMPQTWTDYYDSAIFSSRFAVPIFECAELGSRPRITGHENDGTNRNARSQHQFLGNNQRPDGIGFQVVIEVIKRTEEASASAPRSSNEERTFIHFCCSLLH